MKDATGTSKSELELTHSELSGAGDESSDAKRNATANKVKKRNKWPTSFRWVFILVTAACLWWIASAAGFWVICTQQQFAEFVVLSDFGLSSVEAARELEIFFMAAAGVTALGAIAAGLVAWTRYRSVARDQKYRK